MSHLRVAFHVPNGRLTQDDLDTALECVERMALQQNKGNRPVFLMLDTKKVRDSEILPSDQTVDFVVRLYGEKRIG